MDTPQDPQDQEGSAQPHSASDLIASLGDDKLLAALNDERNVSIVYINRSSTVYGAAAGAAAGHAPATRIGDITVNAISAGELAAVQATFTPPLCFDEAQRRLRERGVLLLVGPGGSGKRSAAIALLAALTFDADRRSPIYELNPDLRLADLDPDAIPPDTPLLLETPDGAALAGMSAFRWSALADKLAAAQHNNGLVITLERLPAAFAAEGRGMALTWRLEWPGDRTEVQWNVLHRHLRYRATHELAEAGDVESQLAAWRRHAGLAALLAQTLSPGELAALAALLLPALLGRCDLDTALARHESHVAEAVQSWFENGGHPLDIKLLLVAAAVYNEALADEVEAAADDLLTLWRGTGDGADKAEPKPPADPFAAGGTRSRRFRQIGAGLAAAPLDGLHYGATSGQILRLDNNAWQKAVLDYVWTEIGPLRTPLLIWLERGAAAGSRRRRVRAAAAMGALARLNFAQIEEGVLRRWAGSGDPNLRRAAGQVLGITLWDEQHSVASAGLLRYWATADNWRYRWTAATACAGIGGERFPQQTLEILGRIAEACVEHPQLLEPVTQAVINLFLAARLAPDRRAALLHSLRQWSERQVERQADRQGELQDDPPGNRHGLGGERDRVFAARRTALLCFWLILWPAPGDLAWRLLVEDLAAPGPVQEDGVALLRGALNFRQPDGSVRDTLHPRTLARKGLHAVTAAVAKENGDLAPAWTGVLHALVQACRQADAATGSDEAQRLHDYAEDWDDLPAAAAALRNLLL